VQFILRGGLDDASGNKFGWVGGLGGLFGVSYKGLMKFKDCMPVALVAAGVQLLCASVLADGCFVFRWDKKTDINEPTQKAVILHHAGREDLLLQVKYEGAVDEFGWLIPVPSEPTVERGSMTAFYELSELTQRNFGGGLGGGVMTKGADTEGKAPQVKVIETKTAGAYRVSILAANDAAGLENWLKENRYSIPGGKIQRGVVDDYIRRGWFFVAAKIDLTGGTGFEVVAGKAQGSGGTAKARSSVQQKLASGELHPLLISFDTAKCVFPLKISSVGGKASEVSLYVLSEKPLLDQFIFDEACANLEKERADWESRKPERTRNMMQSAENSRVMQLQWRLSAEGSRTKFPLEDLQATVRESAPPVPEPSFDEDFYGGSELLHCMLVKADQISKAAKSIPRLKKKDGWYLTKFTRTYLAAEMRDLEFEPAIPALAETLRMASGRSAAIILTSVRTEGVSALMEACRSNDSMMRENAARGLGWAKDSRVVEPLLALLKDKTPAVRFHAARAVGNNWDPRFVAPLIALLRDPYREIGGEAAGWLAVHEGPTTTPKYVAMVNDSNPNVRACALSILVRISPQAIPREPVLQMLKDANADVQHTALHTISTARRNDIASRADLLPILSSGNLDDIWIAINLINRSNRNESEDGVGATPRQRDVTQSLTMSEAIPLVTNRFAEARCTGLRVLQRIGDAKAIELTLPRLRDTNSVVRNRAFAAMKAMTRESVSDSDPAKWENWWKTNEAARTQLGNERH
jgi:HEAT repeat protein